MRTLVFRLLVFVGCLGGEDRIQPVASFLMSQQQSRCSCVPFVSKIRQGIVRRHQPPRICRRSTAADSTLTRLQRQLIAPANSAAFPRKVDLMFLALFALSSNDSEFVEAEDFEALQVLFSKYCDTEGLMTRKAVMKIPAIADLMAAGDLLPEEFSDIFDRAPKFPDAAAVVDTDDAERIDVDSFVQVYRDIDDLFEKDDDGDGESGDGDSTVDTNNETPTTQQSPQLTTDSATEGDDSELQGMGEGDGEDDSDDEPDPSLEAELESIYESLCDKDGLISKAELRKWDEIAKLLEDGLLGDDEFAEIWDATEKASSGGADEKLDVDGFLSFNVALDDLFAFEDDEMDDDDVVVVPKSTYYTMAEDDAAAAAEVDEYSMIEGGDLPPDVLFVSLANEDGLIGLDELQRWSELRELIAEGDLLESELLDMFKRVKKSEMDLNKVEEEGFIALYNAIDSLFEEDGDYGEDGNAGGVRQVSRKEELLDAIADLEGESVLPCGLEATALEQREILSIVELIENEPTNLIRSKQGAIAPQELSGNWELLYSSSSAMKFNKGLSGLGGSLPNGRFGNLKQRLVVTKFLTDVEYIEHIVMVPSSASFDVTVTGTWDLRTSVSLFTGEPSLVMNVVPDRVTYGPTSTRADHWKSLGPMNMLDITYLDEDLRIMRGNTAVETIFVFRRT